jgi:autophagy-related protein 9
MASNVFSRFVPPAQGARSFYDELRNQDDSENVDERNLRERFHHHDVENDMDGGESQMTVDSAANIVGAARTSSAATQSRGRNRDRWQAQEDEGDDDVPASLLVEAHEPERAARPGQMSRPTRGPRTSAVPGPSNARTRAQWEATQVHQRLHDEAPEPLRASKGFLPAPVVSGFNTRSARDKAAWRWVNVTNLDAFVLDVYNYFDGSGLRCIMIDRVLHLVEVTFLVVFTTFLTQCVDHSSISGAKTLEDIIIPHCTRNMSPLWNLLLWFFIFYFIWKLVQFVVDVRRLSHLRDFYVHLLGMPDQDMQTVSWQDVVARIMALRDSHAETATNLGAGARKYIGSQSKKRLDAHDIANRLMRKENFLIAMINKDVLNFSLSLPFLGRCNFYSRTLQWYLNFAIVEFIFDSRGQVHQEFLRSRRRGTLSAKLRQRFVFAGVMATLFAPFMLVYILVFYFFNTFYASISPGPLPGHWRLLTGLAGVSERSVQDQCPAVHAPRRVEVSRIQRASSPLP